ncbi:MAG: succinate dehydrogenase/fumarate reductase iron-sulfur subunit [Halobacteriota archaeon]
MKLKVYRYREGMTSPRYDTFEFDPRPGMTVLEALFQFQEKFDDSLAFHYSCRGAVCGTCAMLINKVPRLACRTQVGLLAEGQLKVPIVPYAAVAETVPWDPEEEVLVEPLPHLPVIRDLIVDMTTFFQEYRFIEPVFIPPADTPERERIMDPAAVKKLEVYTNCILCAACSGACPVEGTNPKYLGPAALAKLYRFYIDPREARSSRLKIADIPTGWWACEFYGNCSRVCPKGVPPKIGIAKAVAQLKREEKEKLKKQ